MVKKRVVVVFLSLLFLVNAMFAFCLSPLRTSSFAAEVENPKVLYYYKLGSNTEEEKLCQSLQSSNIIKEYKIKIEDDQDGERLPLYPEEIYDGLIDLRSVREQSPYLIFEVESVLFRVRSWFFVLLYDTFKELKEAGFKIMFICNTDEPIFESKMWVDVEKNGVVEKECFLNYVDIHINKDIMEPYLLNIVYDIYCDFDKSFDWHNLTLLISQYLRRINFVENRIYPILKKAYASNLDKGTDEEISDLCNQQNIKFLYQGESLSDEELYSYVDGQKSYAIGMTWGSEEDITAWVEWVEDIRGRLGILFPSYLCYASIAELYIPGFSLNGSYDITPIIRDFLKSTDLRKYDNWSGKCNVTHKTVIFSEDGWMSDLWGEGDSDFLDFMKEVWYESGILGNVGEEE